MNLKVSKTTVFTGVAINLISAAIIAAVNFAPDLLSRISLPKLLVPTTALCDQTVLTNHSTAVALLTVTLVIANANIILLYVRLRNLRNRHTPIYA